jgi:tetratricopeptide (TPR) repeat protein
MSDIQKLIANRQWKKAQSVLKDELLFHPSDHWLWFTLSSAHYELKEYDLALRCARRAVELAPACPLALWHYAGALYMCEQEDAAFAIWMVLVNGDIDQLAEGDHGEGMDWALQLVNDVQYRLALYYQRHGMDELARQSFEKYLHNRKHGVGSIYSASTAEKHLAAAAS